MIKFGLDVVIRHFHIGICPTIVRATFIVYLILNNHSDILYPAFVTIYG